MKWFYTKSISRAAATIEGDENKHLTLVMRARVGDNVICFDGTGKVAECEIEETSKSQTQSLFLLRQQ